MRRRRFALAMPPALNSLIGIPIVAICFMAGCVIKSSQLQELDYHLNDNEVELKPYKWQLSWNRYEKAVYSVDMNPVYVFGNMFGDSITIRNFNLLEAQGLGQFNYLWQFIEKDGYIMAYDSGQLQATYQCSEWNTSKKPSLDSISVMQRCISTDGKVYRNTIKLDADGSVREIMYNLFGDKTSLILKKI